MAQYDINLRDYFRILRRRRGIVILVPLLFGVFSFTLAFLQAPTPLYRATAVVRVERALSVTGLLQELVAYNPDGNLGTQAALIKGFPVMSAAAKKLGLIPGDATAERIQATPAYLQVLQDLQDQVEVKRVEATNLIEISATAPDPDDAVRIANSLAEAFREDNYATRNRQVREAREFIEKQLEGVGAKLRQSEDGLKAYQEANAILLLPEETKGILNRLAGLEVDYARVRRAVGETEAQVRLLGDGKSPARPTELSPDAADPAQAKLYASLSDLTLERENLLLSFLPAHPQVKQLDARIANVREKLREALTGRVQALQARADELGRSIGRLKQQQATIPEAALEIARMEREVKVSERIFSLLKEKHQETLIKEKEQVGEVSLVRPAVGPLRPINAPQAVPKAAVGLVIGIVVGFVLAFVVETLDTSIGAIDEVESLLETSVLGVIPHLDVRAALSEEKGEAVVLDKATEERYGFLISLFLPASRIAEAFRGLRTNLLFSGLEGGSKTIMVTSSTQMEGKTTVAINLAIALSQLGKRTLLVEADLRNPFLHHAFGIPKDPGLTEVLVGNARLEEAIRGFPDFVLGVAGVEGLVDRRGIDNLFLLPSGRQPPNPTEFLSTEGVTNLLDEVRQRYDYVVLDCAPVLPVADPAILGSRVDGTLVVVRVGSAARAALRRAKTLLQAARARIVGVCLTGVRAEVSPDYAEMAYYRYRYGDRSRRPAPATGWASLLASHRKSVVGAVVLAPLFLLALTAGVWAWWAGEFDLFPDSRELADSASPGTAPPVPVARARVEVPAQAEPSPDLRRSDDPERPKGPERPTYAVQVGVFRTRANADRHVARYRAEGLRAAVSEVRTLGDDRWWRVLVGAFHTRGEAEVFGWDLILDGEVEGFRVVSRASGR
ncbi:MAG: polysaccharide biosynthesis tyrosine autokinase [Candidatus Rokubacteria bacterium]|nr:polysaccharide biosynthesis tyrosine autokinase [Candidatus Rokubacteria bacterium]